jgi:hypothetical protein
MVMMVKGKLEIVNENRLISLQLNRSMMLKSLLKVRLKKA